LEFASRVQDAIDDIKVFLGWNMGDPQD